MTKVLGLTGGIASGKSTVSQYFKQKKIPVVDADIGAREVVKKGQPGLDKIVQHFGEDVLLESGELNRPALLSVILEEDKKREELNQLLDPYIRNWILSHRDKWKEKGHPLIVLDIPLLYEAKYDKEVDEVMVVFVENAIQVERLMKREEITKEEAIRRIRTQMSLDKKKEKADIQIDNNGSKEQTFKQVEDWLNQQKA